jgi:hypothetical protein
MNTTQLLCKMFDNDELNMETKLESIASFLKVRSRSNWIESCCAIHSNFLIDCALQWLLGNFSENVRQSWSIISRNRILPKEVHSAVTSVNTILNIVRYAMWLLCDLMIHLVKCLM